MDKPRLQFSVAALLLTVTAVAGAFALIFQVHPKLGRQISFFMVPTLSALAITGLVYGRPTLRTFCIGAIVPLGMMLIVVGAGMPGLADWLSSNEIVNTGFAVDWGRPFSGGRGIPRLFGSGILLSITLGYLCVLFRWLIDRPGK